MQRKRTANPAPPRPAPSVSANGKKLGRPAFKPTDEQRDTVAIMVAFGHTEVEISEALGLARMTVRRYFETEIAKGRSVIRSEVLTLLMKSARSGNVAAIKHVEAMTSERNNDGKLPYRLPENTAPGKDAEAETAEEKEEKLGKKAQKLKDAQNPDPTDPMGALMAERHEPAKHGKVQ